MLASLMADSALSAYLLPSLAAFLLYILLRSRQSTLRNLRGPTNASWFLGSWGVFLDNPSMALTDKWTAEYGGAFKFGDFFSQDRLYLSDPAALNHILNVAAYRFPKQAVTRQRIGRVLGKGLVWAEGEDHRRQRRIMSYAFIRARVKEQYKVFCDVTDRLSGALLRDITDGKSGTVNVNDIMSRATMDIILEAGLDYPCNTLENAGLEIVNIYRGFMLAAHGHQSDFFKIFNEYTARIPSSLRSLIEKMPTKRYKDIGHRKRVTDRFSRKIVEDKMAEVERGDRPTTDSIGIMIKANMAENEKARMSKQEIIEQVSTLIQAGHDTTAATLSWLLDTLATETEWQERLRKEVLEFREQHDNPTMDDYDNFKLLNAVVKEGIRLQTTVPYITRECAEDDVIPLSKPIIGRDGSKIDHIVVKKGTKVDGGLGDYNHSKELWGQDAFEFKPERWLRPEGPLLSDEVVAGTWGGLITFITGPRTCLGWRFAVLEMQMFTAEILAKFKIERIPNAPDFDKPNAPVVQPYFAGQVQMPLKLTVLSD